MKVINEIDPFVVRLNGDIDFTIEEIDNGKKITWIDNKKFKQESVELPNSLFWKSVAQMLNFCENNNIIVVPNCLIDKYEGFEIYLVTDKKPYFIIQNHSGIGYFINDGETLKFETLNKAKDYIDLL